MTLKVTGTMKIHHNPPCGWRLQLWGVQEGDPQSRAAVPATSWVFGAVGELRGGGGDGDTQLRATTQQLQPRGNGSSDSSGLCNSKRHGMGDAGCLPRAKTYLTGHWRMPGRSSLPQNRPELV